MYAIRVGNEKGLRTNDVLRMYARTEYGNPEIAWFLAAEARRAKPRPARPSLRSRLLKRHARPALRSLPHKGTPGLALAE